MKLIAIVLDCIGGLVLLIFGAGNFMKFILNIIEKRKLTRHAKQH